MRLAIILPVIAYSALSLASSVTLTKDQEDARGCGFKIAPCPSGTVCVADDPTCPPLRGENCAGKCLKAKPTPTTLATKTTTKLPRPTYQSCGGFRIERVDCPKGFTCVDDPYVRGCGMACDRPGICVDVREPEFCGGFAGFRCKNDRMCIDDPRDDCDPKNGGADCGGICV